MASFIIGTPTIEHRGDRSILASRLGGERAEVSISAPLWLRKRLRPTAFPFVPMGLLMAIEQGADVCVEPVVDDTWWANLGGAFIPLLGDLYDRPRIRIKRAATARGGGWRTLMPRWPSVGDTALMFSAGVDSFYSRAMLRSLGVAYRWFINVNAGAHDDDYDCWKARLSNVAQVAAFDQVGLIVIDTNFHRLVPMDHVRSHVIRNICASFALYPAVTTIVYSSAYCFPAISFEAAKYSIDHLDHTLLSTMTPPGISVPVMGWDTCRIAKTQLVAQDALVHAHLDVCTNQAYQAARRSEQPLNCGQCAKCLRTMLTIDHAGQLARFASVFSLEEFCARREGILDLISQSSNPLDRSVVQLFR